jgi:hypothetical protein
LRGSYSEGSATIIRIKPASLDFPSRHSLHPHQDIENASILRSLADQKKAVLSLRELANFRGGVFIEHFRCDFHQKAVGFEQSDVFFLGRGFPVQGGNLVAEWLPL